MGSVGEVEPSHIHARLDQGADPLDVARRGTERAHDLGAARQKSGHQAFHPWNAGLAAGRMPSILRAIAQREMGWMTGLEPATTGATVQCSAN